jgi:spore coat polysaccharide biosynthesis predicted glycosyltransferase SpsG
MGGSDIRGTTPTIVRAFDGLGLEVDVIIGPGFDNGDAIERAVRETDANFDVVEDPNDLPERMFEADFAVSATGTTIYELLALGTPTIGLPQADNQEPIAKELAEREAIETADGSTSSKVHATIEMLSTSPKRRRELRDRGTSLLDASGAERVYDVLTEGIA